MKTLTTLSMAAMIFAGTSSLALSADTHNLTVEGQAYAFQTAPQQKNGAAFLTINNADDHDHLLQSVSGDVSDHIEIHSMSMDGGKMEMRKLDALPIPAQGDVALTPSGYHLMLIGLNAPLTLDNNFPLSLHFEDGHVIETSVSVVKPGTKPE